MANYNALNGARGHPFISLGRH